MCLQIVVCLRNTAVLQNQLGQTPKMTTLDEQLRIGVDEIQDVLYMTLHTEFCKHCDLYSPTWSSTPMCFCNRRRLSQQEPDPAIL